MAYADEHREHALVIKAPNALVIKAHADQGPESNVQMMMALLQRRDAACARLKELVGEESDGESSLCSSSVQRRARPGSASPDGPLCGPARGAHPIGQPSKTRRPMREEQWRSEDGLLDSKSSPRRSEDGLSNPKSRSPKGRDADAETRPQAQRKGMFSLLASELYYALTRTKTSKTGSPETRSKAVSPETRSARLPETASSALSDEDAHMVPPAEHHVRSKHRNTSKDARTEPTRLRPKDEQSRSMREKTSVRKTTPGRHGTHLSQSFTYGEQNHHKDGTQTKSPSELNKTKSPSELREELLALFGAAKESGAVKEVDGYESPPPRSPTHSRVKKAGGAPTGIAPFKASHHRH
jgi:hypothetical protein